MQVERVEGSAVRTSWGSATDRGRVRRLNEDALLAYPPVFLVADGMGGHAAGDVASRLAVEEFSQLAGRAGASPDEVHACFHRTATRLRETVAEGRTAGTTVAGVAIAAHDGGSYWLVFNIGDSRVYRLAAGGLVQISVDHSVVQEMIDAGELLPEDAPGHPERHIITRAVGTGSEPEPDYWLIPAGTSDRLLICSDGLTTELSDVAIHRVLSEVADPQDAAQRLVADALVAGGRDNVSAVVVDVAAAHDAADVELTQRSNARDGRSQASPAAPDDHDPWDDEIDGSTVPSPTRSRVPEVNR
ncbi:protein phosphatase 2C domain-containing protein [Actinotalea sp. K2]|uniref:PP2C family protein-serine/threonine phosphatase n=1 Tax=Actinotalea sp. K2 TaxID=2939438 RepID=UPI0020176576|nr:protein phosphatase 2C domain-containing protein [Actinotalea sp. K2]MCL3863206.1 protein phosphatase 2C domain-containing protein [Actinotalea sp. K2]